MTDIEKDNLELDLSNEAESTEEQVHEEVADSVMAAADALAGFEEGEESTVEQNANDERHEGEELMAMLADDSEVEADQTVEESAEDVSGTELESFESAEVEEELFVSVEEIESIVESMLFATDKPQTLGALKQAFKGTNVRTKHLKQAIENLMIEYASPQRGVTLEEVQGGYQLRTKVDNMEFLKRMIKARSFKLSGPALEVLSIVAYKQPCIKHDVDEVRGVESGHLMRGLMDRGLICFAGKSELPGKPMLYSTTKKFLEIFGLRNLNELPSLSEIDTLIPEGIGDEDEKESLDMITDSMSEDVGSTYSEGEEELEKISGQLSDINTSSEFFEDEKRRMKAKRDAEKARDIKEAIDLGEEVSNRDKNWLERYEAQLAEEQAAKEAELDKEIQEEGDVSSAMEEELSADDIAEEGEVIEAAQDIAEEQILVNDDVEGIVPEDLTELNEDLLLSENSVSKEPQTEI